LVNRKAVLFATIIAFSISAASESTYAGETAERTESSQLPVNTANSTKSPPTDRDKRFATLRKKIEATFPDVKHLSIDTFLSDATETLLIDVRGEEEYAVSRIPGAVHAVDYTALANLVANKGTRRVVLYCSVGWRSAQAAEHLHNLGATNVYNLHGSIFEWANRSLPLVDEAGQTAHVHPYNFVWGWLYLHEDLRK